MREYTVEHYGRMVADDVRRSCFCEALRHAIKPGDVVLEIGTGVGFFALEACRLGASRVYAVEPNEAIHVAKELARSNGFAERIEFIQALSTDTELPQAADLLLWDLRGMLPLLDAHLPAIIDARRRLLRPGGVLINERDTLFASLVEAPDCYHDNVSYLERAFQPHRCEPIREIAANTSVRTLPSTEQLLVDPQRWLTLDYRQIEPTERFSTELQWTPRREGVAHGLLVWFEAELAGGVRFCTGPGEPWTIYGSTFFPLREPVIIHATDRIQVKLAAQYLNGRYVWRWQTMVEDEGGTRKASYDQSTFAGAVLSARQLACLAGDYVPVVSHRGEVTRFALSLFDGKRTSGQIAAELLRRWPDDFTGPVEAADFVARLVADMS